MTFDLMGNTPRIIGGTSGSSTGSGTTLTRESEPVIIGNGSQGTVTPPVSGTITGSGVQGPTTSGATPGLPTNTIGNIGPQNPIVETTTGGGTVTAVQPGTAATDPFYKKTWFIVAVIALVLAIILYFLLKK